MLKMKNALTISQEKQSYALPTSLLQHLPWVECSDKEQCILLNDKTVGAAFELNLIPSESLNDTDLNALRDGLQSIFQNTFPLYREEESPWVMQCYVNDEWSLQYLYQAVQSYIQPTENNSDFSKSYLQLMKTHTEWLSKPNGVFVDEKVTGNPFHGGQRKVRVVIYRQYSDHMRLHRGRSTIQDLHQVTTRFITKLKSLGICAKRLKAGDFQEWLIRWFNPKPSITSGNTDKLITKIVDRNKTNELPFGYDFSETLFYSVPESDEKSGVWYFDGLPHRYLAIQHLTKVPEIGQLTRELSFGHYRTGLFDQFPEGAVFVLTVTFQSQETVKAHLARIEDSARKSQTMAASITFEECQIAKASIEKGNYLLPASMGVYLCAKDLDDLSEREIQVESLLLNNGFQVIHGDHELLGIHNYLHYLPLCYRYAFDKKYAFRSSYVFSKQLANLLPLYGRERGTGHPLLQFFNRGGESFSIDPFNPQDKDQNSHLLILGSTGSGKSATSTDLLIKLMGTYKPHLVIIDAGNSFHLLRDYFLEQGLSVHSVSVTMKNPPILNPFVDSHAMLEQVGGLDSAFSESILDKVDLSLEAENQDSSDHAEQRDYLGEMALAAQLMITGGEKQAQADITRQDRLLILDALVRAAHDAKVEGFDQMIPSDVVRAFLHMEKALRVQNKEPEKQQRLRFMADSMAFFTKDTVASRVFNRRGTPWPTVDVTLFEQGLFKDEGYEAHNALAFMGLMSRTMAKAEAQQFEERFTVVYGDEIHTLTKNELTVIYLTKCAKMSRKFGLWLWLATQNMADFPKEAKKILSMMEFWICLGMSEAEIQAIEQFRVLTDEEKHLFRSVRKAAKKYVEGVLLCPRVKALFRNVPPRLSLALAMTEKQEKAERRRWMKKLHCSEIEAAKHIAEEMMK